MGSYVFMCVVMGSVLQMVWCSGCVIKTDEITRTEYTELLAKDTTDLLRIGFDIPKKNRPDFDSWDQYLMEEWQVVTKESGQYILTSHPDIELFSLGYFTLKIENLKVPLKSDPSDCLQNVTENHFKDSIMNLLFSNLMSPENRSDSALANGVKVCYEAAMIGGKTVSFNTQCCSQPNACAHITTDWWQDFLFYLITVLNFIAFLWVANLVPDFLYRDRYGYLNFYYKLDNCSTFRVVDKSEADFETDAELEIEALQKPASSEHMTSLQDAVKGDKYSVKGIWFKAPENRLVTKSYLPIGLGIFLYQRLVQCTCYTYRGHATPPLKLRHITAMRDYPDHGDTAVGTQDDFSVRICCDLPICNPENRLFKPRFPKWSTVLHVIMTTLSAFILAIPWIVIYVWDEHTMEGKRGDFASERGLIYSPPFWAFNILRFVKVTVPGLSIACMIIFALGVLIISIILQLDEEEKMYVGVQLRSSLRNAKDRWDTGVIKWSNLLVTVFLPFKVLRNYGLIALLLWPFWIVLVCPFTILIAILGNTPTVNIFLRLLIVFIKDIVKIFTTRQIRNNTSKSIEKCILYISLILVLFIVHLLAFALVSLVVNILAYTLVACLVTAQATMRYTTFAILIIVNARDCFLAVEQRYAIFNEKLQAEILSQTHDEIKKLAKRQKNVQINKAFKIQIQEIEEAPVCSPHTLWENMAISGKNKMLWNAKSVVQFLDNEDKVYLSEKFFFDACYMDYYGCPGDFSSSLFLALRQLFLITAFLAFVVFTLNAFGGLEENSASGLLVTLLYGLLPLFIRRFFSTPIAELSLDTTDFNFQNHLDRLIYKFSEYWEIVDLDVEKLENVNVAADVDAEAKFWLKLGNHNSIQLGVDTKDMGDEHADDIEEERADELRTDNIEMVVVGPDGDAKTEDKNGGMYRLGRVLIFELIC